MGGVHLVSPDVGGKVKPARRLLGPAGARAPTAQARAVIATHYTTPGTVQMALMTTATVAGCGLVMPGRQAHDITPAAHGPPVRTNTVIDAMPLVRGAGQLDYVATNTYRIRDNA